MVKLETFIDGVGYVDPATTKRWSEQEQDYIERNGYGVETYDPADFGAVRAKDVKVGDHIKHDFDQSEMDFDPESIYDYEVAEIHTDDNKNWYDIRFVTTDGKELHWDADDYVGYVIDPADFDKLRKNRAEYDLKTYEDFDRIDEGEVYRYNYGDRVLEPALPADIGKVVWQSYLYPVIKKFAREQDIDDTNKIIHAVKDWLNRH